MNISTKAFPRDLAALTHYFFVAPETYDEKSLQKVWKPENKALLERLREKLAAEPQLTEATEHSIHEWIQSEQLPMGQMMNAFRLAVLGISQGPSIFAIAEFIGKEETLKRIDRLIEEKKL